MAAKAAHYVAHLCETTPEQAQVVLDLLLSGDLPPLEYGRSLDDWWLSIVRRKRQEIGLELIDMFGSLCEACEEKPATDLHEVFSLRSEDMSWKQIFNFSVQNCCLLCRRCHESMIIHSAEFKEKVSDRRKVTCETW